MKFAWSLSGIAAGMLVVLGNAATPASGAGENASIRPAKHSVGTLRGFGAFTPASTDPRLAAIFARGGLDTGGFRFTPSDQRRDDRHAVKVAVVARSNRVSAASSRIAAPIETTTLRPIAYNLGVAVGWKRFTIMGGMAKIDLAGLPGGRESADIGLSYSGRRFTGRVRAGTDRPLSNDGPRLIEEAPAYSIDVGGSYSLTRRLDVTAGVRYKSERDRLVSTAERDNHRDSQAVYVGTAFRF